MDRLTGRARNDLVLKSRKTINQSVNQIKTLKLCEQFPGNVRLKILLRMYIKGVQFLLLSPKQRFCLRNNMIILFRMCKQGKYANKMS